MSNLTPRLRVPICFCAVGRSRKAHIDSTRTRIDSSEPGRNSSNSVLGHNRELRPFRGVPKEASSYNRESHEVDPNHFHSRPCSIPARGQRAEPAARIDVGSLRCTTGPSASACGVTPLTVAARSFFSAEDKQHSRIGYQADPEWSDHARFGSN